MQMTCVVQILATLIKAYTTDTSILHRWYHGKLCWEPNIAGSMHKEDAPPVGHSAVPLGPKKPYCAKTTEDAAP